MTVVIDGTTGISGVDGSASNPSYEGTDSNTGIFFPAADTIAFAEGGTEVARFDSSGNFGIGTTTPIDRLHVTKAGSEVVRLTNSQSNGGDWEFKLGGGGFEDRKFLLTDKYGGADNVRVAVDSSGNVGIGTVSPDSVSNFRFLDVGSSGTNQGVIQANNGTVKTAIYTNGVEGYVATRTNHNLNFQVNGNNQAGITTAGLFQFNSGYGSVATAYGCRAWVNFDGTSNTANLSGTYSQSGTTVTVTATAHGLIAGNVVYSDITTGTAVDGTYTVATVTDANTFTYTAGTSLTTSGNVTLRRNTIRASGNVSSIADNGVGSYTVNFTTAMPDANYSVLFTPGGQETTSTANFDAPRRSTTPTTTTVQILYSNGNQDTLYGSVAIFR